MRRLSVEIPNDLFDELEQLIPSGVKSGLVRSMLVMLVTEVKANGGSIIGDIMTNDAGFSKISNFEKTLNESEKGGGL